MDRLRSYLLSGVPEYWILNPSPEPIANLPPRAGLFLCATPDGRAWRALEGDGLVHAPGLVHGLPPVVAGRLRSEALGLTFDLDALWTQLLGA